MNKKRKYLYMLFIGACPVCGTDVSRRVRQYDKRPPDARDRVVRMADTIALTFCHCQVGGVR